MIAIYQKSFRYGQPRAALPSRRVAGIERAGRDWLPKLGRDLRPEHRRPRIGGLITTVAANRLDLATRPKVQFRPGVLRSTSDTIEMSE